MSSFHRILRNAASVSVAAAALVPTLAWAQQAAVVDADEVPASDANDIVVTGTLLRGAAPVGSSLISAGEAQLQSTASATSNELLATIPQVTNLFGSDPSRRYGIAVNQIQIARPNLRNISPDNASSSSTLVLFDGHRVASAGVTQASIDPDLLPTAAIERVEVVTDGGSATYGADAVGGVINFITRKRFDGVRVDARYGFAESYWSFDANAIAGKDWGSGSLYIAYTFNKSSALFGRDREWINNRSYSLDGGPVTTPENPNGFRDLNCAIPNYAVTTGGVTTRFNGTNGTFGTGRRFCDLSDNAAFIPEVERHGAMVGLTQELSDTISVDMRAFYSNRKTRGYGVFVPASTVSIPSTNFYYTQIPGTAAGATQSVNLNFGPALGNEQLLTGTNIEQWGASGEFKAELTDNWQLRTLFNYSQTDSSLFLNSISASRLNAAGSSGSQSGAINPYNVAATNPALLTSIVDNQEGRQTKDHLLDLRAIVDGTLFSLPGGDVRVALGYEYMHDFTQRRFSVNAARGAVAGVPYTNYRRNVHAAFGEVQIPVFGAENAVPGIQSLVFSAQGRYDHYSDFGGTFNPKLGLNYKPVDWFTLRGNWSRSFNAPTPLDQLAASSTLLVSGGGALRLFSLEPTGVTDTLVGQGAVLVSIQGSQSGLKPQTAETWSVGFDVEPPIVPGLRASMSYYNVKFNGILKTPSPFDSRVFAAYPNITKARATGFTSAEVQAFLAQQNASGLLNNSDLQAALNCTNNCLPSGTLVYGLLDFRTSNYTNLKTSGIDWMLSYRRPVGFGSIDASFSGNLRLDRQEQLNITQPFRDDQFSTDLRMQTILGANVGEHVRTQVTWNHTSGNFLVPTAAFPQTRADAFNTFDLFLRYDVKGERLMSDLSFTFNVRNLLNEGPPLSRNSGVSGVENGYSVLGRQFFFGVSKKF